MQSVRHRARTSTKVFTSAIDRWRWTAIDENVCQTARGCQSSEVRTSSHSVPSSDHLQTNLGLGSQHVAGNCRTSINLAVTRPHRSWLRHGCSYARLEGMTTDMQSQFSRLTSPQKAIANLRAFTSQPTNWYRCPLTRRAAVLILLFADKRGDLRVVLTIRSAGLKNCELTLPKEGTHSY